MTAAVTGASGHIGNNLCRELVNQGYKVKALVRTDVEAIKDLDIQFIKGEITEKESLSNLIEGADVVFHLAAVISIEGSSKGILHQTNVEGTQNLIDVCMEKNIKRFIHFSSIHALSQYPLDKELTEENPLAGKEAYAYDQSKAEAERIVLEAHKKGLNAVILNPTSVLGVYDYKKSFIGQAILKIANGKLPALIPGGFDWVDVRDVVFGAISAIDKGRSGERYLLSGHWKSLEDLASEINKHTNRKNPIKVSSLIAHIGVPFIYLYSKITGAQPLYTNESLNILAKSNTCVSNEKAIKELGFSSRPFSETIKDMIRWFRERKLINS